MIRQMGYAAYFLTVADIAADIRAMGIRAACRGSRGRARSCATSPASPTSTPLRHDLSFERFMNPMRDELPDIDIDVESARREDVYDMILSRHGDERAGVRRDDRHLPRALGGPRGGQGARPARRRGGRDREGVPAHLGAPPARGDGPPARAPGHQPEVRAARAAVPGRRAPGRVPAPHRAASLRHRAGRPRPGRARAAGAQRGRPSHDPGGQGRRRAAGLPEARHPRRADALVDAPRARRDRPHHRREGRPRADPAGRRADVRADPRLRHPRVLPDRVARPARAAPEAAAHAMGGPDRRHLAVPARPGEVRHDPALPPPARRAGAPGLRPPGSAARRCRRPTA